jgi:hypothetical protein
MAPLAGGILLGLEQCGPEDWMNSVSTSAEENEHTAERTWITEGNKIAPGHNDSATITENVGKQGSIVQK